MRDDVRWYFPGLCGVSESTMWHSRQVSVNTFPHVPYSQRIMIVLRRSLYGVVSDGRVLVLFVRLPPAVLTGLHQGANISWETGFGRIVFLSAVFFLFHSWYRSPLIPVPHSIRPSWLQGLSPHTLFLFLRAGSSQDPFTQCGIGVPSEKAAVRWWCFPGRSDLLPMRKALSPRKSWTFSFMLP